jgi:endoglucanase
MKIYASFLLALGMMHQPRRSAAKSSLRRGLEKHPPTAAARWRTAHNALYRGAEAFRLKGINWNGIESDCRVVHGLWEHPLGHYMDVLQEHRFNAVRLPISYEAMADASAPVKSGCTTADRPYASVHAFLTTFLDEALRRDMFVLFDLHSIEGAITEYPWTPTVTHDQVVDAWGRFAKAYATHPAVMGLEIKNEPHGAATTAEFHRHCEAVINRIRAEAPTYDALFFVSGTTDGGERDKAPWGGSLETLPRHCDSLCQLDMADRIVFCPHVYGPDVRGAGASGEGPAAFERRFGFLREHPVFNGSAIVPTEFGGFLQGADGAYFEEWLAFVRKRNYTTDAFFWTFPPTSHDTGGLLLDDWTTLDETKLAFLERLQPCPSRG